MTRLGAALAALAAAVIATASHATVHRVVAGTAWDSIAAIVRPGDEIVLEPGVHRPARLEDLAGEPGRPIVIRSHDAAALARIDGGRDGLELVRPSHVEVRNFLIRGSSGPGVAIRGDGDRPARGILLRNCLIEGCGERDRRPAMLLEGVEGLTLADSRVQGFDPVAISIDRCRTVRIQRSQLVLPNRGAGRTGVEISGGSEGIEIDRLGVGPSIDTTFAVGTRPAEAVAGGPPGPLASGVTISNTFAERNRRFAAIGSVRDLDLRRNTILDPLDTTLLLVPPPDGRPAATAVRFRGNLVAWAPNTLQRLTALAPGFPGPPEVEFGANLWFSAELPAALPLLGTWEGKVAEPQVTDVDPRLDERGLPQADAARAFGCEPQEPRRSAPTGGSPVSPSPAR